jgi:pimeloyl-ACP methyl ester carboxylesterase
MQITVEGRVTYAYTGARPFDPMLPGAVFVHGAGLDHTVWILQSRWFAHHGFNALAVDLPGHGRSAGAPLPDVPTMADWLLACVDALGLESTCLAGHSMGALVALEAAAREPARASAVALLGVSVPMPVSPALLEAARANEHAAIDMITLWGHGHRAQVGGNTAPGMWMTGGAARLLERAPPGLLHNDLAACNAYAGGLEAAACITAPVLVLLGRQDVMASPRNVGPLLEALPDARLTELDPCGHMMMSEQPDGVLDALAAHFRRPR